MQKEPIFYNDEIIKKIEGYEAEGCGIAVDDIFRYVQALIQTKRFQEADSLINSLLLEGNPNYTSQVARLLLYSFRINEAVQLIGSKKELNAYDYEILGKCFLKLGFVASAKRIFNKALEAELNFKVKDVVKRKLLEIYNYEHCGAFLEISYPAFVQSGQNLQVGHVVNLREDPEVIAGDASYDKSLNLKNFLVWKIEDDDIYLIPLTSRIRGTGYVIYKKDYPNIGKDRCVRDYICKSKKIIL